MKLSIPDLPFWVIILLQTIFFLFFILPGTFNLSSFFIILFIGIQISIISMGLLKIGKNKKKIFYLLSEIQIFLLIIVNLIFNVENFFSLKDVGNQVIISLSLILIAAESIFLVYYIFEERAIKKILFILASSTTLLVFLIVFFVAMEGIPAFQENDPVEFLTGNNFNPFYERSYTDTVVLTTNLQPAEFQVRNKYNPLYIPLNESRNTTITIENNGPITDTFLIEVDTLLNYDIEEKEVIVESDESNTVNISFSAEQNENQEIIITVSSTNTNKEKRIIIDALISSTGINIFPNHKDVFRQCGQARIIITIPFEISNLEDETETYMFQVTSPNSFIPTIIEESSLNWTEEKQNNTRIREIELSFNAMETRIITFKPNYVLGQKEGVYPIEIRVYSKNNPQIYTTASITYTYAENQILTVEQPEKNILITEEATFYLDVNVDEIDTNDITISTNILEGEADLFLFKNKNFSKDSFLMYGEQSIDLLVDQLNTSIFTLQVIPRTGVNETIKTEVSLFVSGENPRIVAFPFIIGTIITTIIAVLIAAPLGIGIAIFLAEFAPRRIRVVLKPLYDLLAGIPSVVYGLWGVFTLAPILSEHVYPLIVNSIGKIIPIFSETMHMGEDIFTASVVLSIMIIPIVITLSEDAIRSVKKSLKEGSLALGSTRWQTMRQVILPEAKSGVISSIILGTGRAIGETMAVLMIMGAYVNIPSSVFDRGATMTGIIANNFDYALQSPLTKHGLMAIGLLLFIMVFFLNIIIVLIQRKRIDPHSNIKKKSVFSKILSLSKKNNHQINPKKLMHERKKEKTQSLAHTHNIIKNQSMSNKFTIVGDSNIGGKSVKQTREEKDVNLKNKLNFDSKVIKKSLFKQKIIVSLLLIVVGLISFSVIFIIGDILANGGTGITLELFLEREIAGGKEGGFLNAIVGSLYLVTIALIVSLPLSIGSAIYVQEYTKKDTIFTKIIMFTSDTLASTPSIVFGAFGFLFFVVMLDFGFSLIAGGLTLGIMVIPLMLRSSIEAIKAIPRNFQEGALALGATKWQSIRTVILPPAMSGIVSGVIISVGRAIGETAAVLLTAGYSAFIPISILHGTASMPNLIWLYYDSSRRVPLLGEKVYVAAAVLIIIVLFLNGIARLFSYQQSKLMKE